MSAPLPAPASPPQLENRSYAAVAMLAKVALSSSADCPPSENSLAEALRRNHIFSEIQHSAYKHGMVELGIKLIYNLVIFQEYKLLPKCEISCELLPRMAKEIFDTGCMLLANLCSGNVILAHCGQIQEIGWERKPHRFFYLPNIKTTTNDNFLASNN